MGGCAGSFSGNSTNRNIKNARSKKFKSLQMDLIELMYTNLSKRYRNNLVNRQTFDLFFHSSGLIGQLLFVKFDTQKNGTIGFQEFLAAFQLMIKGSLREKADILFQIYDLNKSGKVPFNELLKILFSYSTEELNKMFVEEKFLNYIGPTQLSYYFGPEPKKIEEKIILQTDEEQEDDFKVQKCMVQSSLVLMKVKSEIGSEIGTNFLSKEKSQALSTNPITIHLIPSNKRKNRRKSVISSTIISDQEFKKTKNNLKIKSNIASLTKKYAKFLFLSYKLNIETDFFSKDNFFKLIQEHPSLFNAYLAGFHTYAWQVNEDEPEYFRAKSWIQSQAQQRYQGKEESVYLKFIQTTVFVLYNKKKKLPKDIINLQGLTVDTVESRKNDKRQYGIIFKHRDEIYPAKQYYFQNLLIYNDWVKCLDQFKTTTIEDLYVRLDRIGGGSFSNVYKGRERKTGHSVAIKVIQTFKLTLSGKQVLKRQIGILKHCHHPNIIKFLGELKTKTHIYIVTQFLSQGDLFEYTKKNAFLEQYEAAIILKQLIDATLYLNEELGIIHRDLKPENVLIIMNDQQKMIKRVKLIDFGFGIFKDKIKDLPFKEKFAGTPGFIAPQVYKGEEYDQKVDTFSLGIILYFMLSGQFPFHAKQLEEIEEMTILCSVELTNNHWGNISQEAKDLIKKILCFKQERLSTRQVSEHPWLQDTDHLKQLIGRNRKQNQMEQVGKKKRNKVLQNDYS